MGDTEWRHWPGSGAYYLINFFLHIQCVNIFDTFFLWFLCVAFEHTLIRWGGPYDLIGKYIFKINKQNIVRFYCLYRSFGVSGKSVFCFCGLWTGISLLDRAPIKYIENKLSFLQIFKDNYISWTTFQCFDMEIWMSLYTQSTFTCSKLTIETLEQGVKYVQS